MRRVPPEEFRFLLKFALQQLPRSILKDLSGPADKREAALEIGADILFAKFSRHELDAPDPLAKHG